MGGVDGSTRRAGAVAALLIVAAVAVRGYLPGAQPAVTPQRRPADPAALYVDLAIVGVAVAIMVVAIVARMRDRRLRPTPARRPRRRSGETMPRPSLRFVLITFGLLVAWLLLVALLARLGGPDPDPPPEASPASVDASQAPAELAPPAPDESGIDVLVWPMVGLLIVILVGTVIAGTRSRPPVPVDAEAGPSPPDRAQPAPTSLARAAEVGLAEIGDRRRDPRAAIIACYAAMEHELTRVPGAAPQDFDTPTEVLARAVGRGALRAERATRLVDLFEEARFSPHVMTEAHRDVAVQVLRDVLDELTDTRSAV